MREGGWFEGGVEGNQFGDSPKLVPLFYLDRLSVALSTLSKKEQGSSITSFRSLCD